MTTKCNLKCQYCGNQHYRKYFEIEPVYIDEIVNYIMSRGEPLVCLSGGGESTLYNDWKKVAYDLKNKGVKIKLITNLSKKYTEDELYCLSSFDRLVVSIDTVDYEISKNTRKNSNIYIIIYNLTRIMSIKKAFNIPGEVFVSCVVNSSVIDGLKKLVDVVCFLRVDQFNLTNLYIPKGFYDDSLLTKPLCLDKINLNQYRNKLLEIKEYLLSQNVACWLESGLIESLECPIDDNISNKFDRESEIRPHKSVPSGFTRDCLDPWLLLNIHANGNVYPCCRSRIVIGNWRDQSLDKIMTGKIVTKIRENLLLGRLNNDCATCPRKSYIGIHKFVKKVSQVYR